MDIPQLRCRIALSHLPLHILKPLQQEAPLPIAKRQPSMSVALAMAILVLAMFKASNQQTQGGLGTPFSPAVDCTATLAQMQPCLPSVLVVVGGFWNPPDPLPACCQAVETIDPTCFCSLEDPEMPVPGLNRTALLDLPQKCGFVGVPAGASCGGGA